MAEERTWKICVGILVIVLVGTTWAGEEEKLMDASKLKMFVDKLPDMPRIHGYELLNGVPKPKSLRIGMFSKKWKFHRDIPATPVFAYGTSKRAASVPGPTIEALHGVSTYVTWLNHLPSNHILPWDPTIPTATPQHRRGIPTVVHLHGGIDESESDGNSESWSEADLQWGHWGHVPPLTADPELGFTV